MKVVTDQAEVQQIKARRSKPKRRDNIDPAQMIFDETDPDIQDGDIQK